MNRRFDARLKEKLALAEVPTDSVVGLLSRLQDFVIPFEASLVSQVQYQRAMEYFTELLSKIDCKTAVGIAYLHDRERQGLQKFIGTSRWDHSPLSSELARQVGAEPGEPDGVVVFELPGSVKKGTRSAGVARRWCGRVGKTENCQVGIYMAYVSGEGHAIVDARLHLLDERTKDHARCEAAGVPRKVGFRPWHELALEMLKRHGASLPYSWVASDDEMGRPDDFRLKLRGRGERYLLAVPSNTWGRDIEATQPEKPSRGPRPWQPFTRADRWREPFFESAWASVEVRDGENGLLGVEVARYRVKARTPTNGTGPEEFLFVARERQHGGTFKQAYYLSNDDPATPLAELAGVTQAVHRIEECFRHAKREAGLADSQVRTWRARHRHQILALLAAWLLNSETRRGKNPDLRPDLAPTPAASRRCDRGVCGGRLGGRAMSPQYALVATQRASPVLSTSLT